MCSFYIFYPYFATVSAIYMFFQANIESFCTISEWTKSHILVAYYNFLW